MAISNYSKKLFLTGYDYNATSTPKFSTDIVTVQSGYEKRNANWIEPLHEFNISYSLQSEEITKYIKNFYMQMRGPLIAFKFKDWSDYICELNDGYANEDGKLNGLPFIDLYKKYEVDSSFDATYRRIKVIAKQTDEPNEIIDDFEIYFDNVLQNLEVDYDNGQVFLNPISESEIESITNASNGIVKTKTNHSYITNDIVYIDSVENGNSKVNNRTFTITKIDDTSFYLNSSTLNFGEMKSGNSYKYPQNKETIVRWQGYFYNKVRFTEDTITVQFTNYQVFDVPTKLTEIR